MPTDDHRSLVGLKLRFHPEAAERAAAAAGELVVPPILEEDDSLRPGTIVLDVSYDNGEIEEGVDCDQFIERGPL
ncbi:MAG: hypothetical protein WD468_09750 [Pirellulales bacterium]